MMDLSGNKKTQPKAPKPVQLDIPLKEILIVVGQWLKIRRRCVGKENSSEFMIWKPLFEWLQTFRNPDYQKQIDEILARLKK